MQTQHRCFLRTAAPEMRQQRAFSAESAYSVNTDRCTTDPYTQTQRTHRNQHTAAVPIPETVGRRALASTRSFLQGWSRVWRRRQLQTPRATEWAWRLPIPVAQFFLARPEGCKRDSLLGLRASISLQTRACIDCVPVQPHTKPPPHTP